MKKFIGTDVGAYTFNKTAGTVTLTGITTLKLEHVLSILNVTRNEFLYLPPSAGLGGSIASNVITLDVDTSSMDNADRLQILVDLPASDLAPIPVSVPPPPPPEGTTPVTRTAYNSVSGSSDDIYSIPNGETLTIQRLSAGAESINSGNVIELWDDPNGNLTGMSIIDVIFADGASDQHDINQDFVGDGTRRIVMRRLRLSGGNASIFGKWSGYY